MALLAADLALERGHTVAYLTGTNRLADQVLLQARDLLIFVQVHGEGKFGTCPNIGTLKSVSLLPRCTRCP